MDDLTQIALRFNLDSQPFWDLNVECIQKNRGELMSKFPDT